MTGAVRVVRLAGREFRVRFERGEDGRLFADVEGEQGVRQRIEIETASQGRLILDGEPLEYRCLRSPEAGLRVQVGAEGWPVEVLSEGEAALGSDAARGRVGAGGKVQVRAPMPGRVLAVEVAEGDRVEAGAGLFIIEAMKMENEIRAPRGGCVRALSVAEGEAVEQDQRLCELELEEAAAPGALVAGSAAAGARDARRPEDRG